MLAALAVLWIAAPASADAFHVSVTGARVTRPLPTGFLGLALEYNTIPQWVGHSPTVDPVLVRLIHNLDPTGRPVLRVGGQSTDRTWWPVRGMSRPLGVTYDLTRGWTRIAHRLARVIDARLMLGVNLEANRPRIAQVEANGLVRGIGRRYVDALQIGNEPDLYPMVPWYLRLNGQPEPWYARSGTPIFSRPPNYGAADFASEFARTLRVMPSVPIAGPETSTVPWVAAFTTRFLSRRSPVRTLTTHGYGLVQCVTDPNSPQYPSVPNLLSLRASRDLLAGLTPFIGIAHHDGASYRVDEMGSISCNGRAGVSNTMASALWSLDALFSLARSGVDGVNLHTYPRSVNDLFDLAFSHHHWHATVQPLYYGALMFAQAAPDRSRLLRVVSGSPDQLRAWATIGPDHRVRVLLINASARGASTRVHAPKGFGTHAGTLERLRAPSAYAEGGVTLGGRRFGTTRTGVLPAPVPQTVTSHLGAYAVTLPPSSAALLTLVAR